MSHSRVTRILTIVLSALAGTLSSFAQNAPAAMEEGFKNPPNSAKPRVWWHWMNGNITKEGIKLDLVDLLGGGMKRQHRKSDQAKQDRRLLPFLVHGLLLSNGSFKAVLKYFAPPCYPKRTPITCAIICQIDVIHGGIPKGFRGTGTRRSSAGRDKLPVDRAAQGDRRRDDWRP